MIIRVKSSEKHVTTSTRNIAPGVGLIAGIPVGIHQASCIVVWSNQVYKNNLKIHRRKRQHEVRKGDVDQLRSLDWNSANWGDDRDFLSHPPLKLNIFGEAEYAAAVKRLPINEEHCIQYAIGKIFPDEQHLKQVRRGSK